MLNRKYLSEIIDFLPNKRFIILQGARQVGKSTLLNALREHCKQNSIPNYLFTLEQRELLDLLNENPLNIFKLVPQQSEKKIYIFIDEFQYLQDPSNFLKLLYDLHSEDIKLIVTGSSAFYFDQKFQDSLAGRKRIFNIHPLNFEEFLYFKNKTEILDGLIQCKANKQTFPLLQLQELKILYEEYAVYGGYPEVILSNSIEQKKEYLLELANSYLKKDLYESGIKNQSDFVRLYKLLATRTGKLLNVSELSNTLDINQATLRNYLYVLQKTFHIYLIKPFFKNSAKELTKQPKIFLNDSGILNQLCNNFMPTYQKTNRGEFTEQMVFSAFRHKYLIDEIKFWRNKDKNEIDFIIADKFAYEVKFKTPKRLARGQRSFMDKYPDLDLSFVTFEDYSLDETNLKTLPSWLI